MFGNNAISAANLLSWCQEYDRAVEIERQKRNMRYQDVIAMLEADNARLRNGCRAGLFGLDEAKSLIKDLKNERDDYKRRVGELEARIADLEVELQAANKEAYDATNRWVDEHNMYVDTIRALEKQYGFKYFST